MLKVVLNIYIYKTSLACKPKGKYRLLMTAEPAWKGQKPSRLGLFTYNNIKMIMM